jgi:hypothetical protein
MWTMLSRFKRSYTSTWSSYGYLQRGGTGYDRDLLMELDLSSGRCIARGRRLYSGTLEELDASNGTSRPSSRSGLSLKSPSGSRSGPISKLLVRLQGFQPRMILRNDIYGRYDSYRKSGLRCSSHSCQIVQKIKLRPLSLALPGVFTSRVPELQRLLQTYGQQRRLLTLVRPCGSTESGRKLPAHLHPSSLPDLGLWQLVPLE